MSKRFRLIAGVLVVMAASGGVAIRADDFGDENESQAGAAPTEIIVTASAPEDTIGAVPGVLVIELDSDRRPGDVTIADVLRSVPGVDLQRRGSSFESSSVRIRGSDGEQVLVLRDGRPLSDGRSSLVDLSRISLEGVQRVEVVLGPATALYGVGGAAGAINLVSSDGTAAPPGFSGSSRATWGSFGEYHLEADGTVRFPNENTILDVAALGMSARNTYGYDRAGESETRKNAGGTDGALAIGLEQRLTRHQVSIDGSIASFRRGLPGTVEFPSEAAELQETRGGLTLEVFRPGESDEDRPPVWTFSGEIDLGRSLRTFRDREYALGPLASDSDLISVSTRVVGAGPAGPVALRLPLSLKMEFMEDSGLGDRDRIVPAVAPSGRVVMPLPGASELDLSIHTRLETELAGTDPREVLGSVRGGAGWTGASVPVRIALSGGTGYRLPDFSELFLERSAFAVGNPELEPERSRSLETEVLLGGLLVHSAGSDGSVSSGFLNVGVRAAMHVTWYDDLIQWLPDPNGFWRPRNTGRALIYGGELDVRGETPLGLSPWTLEGSTGADLLHARDRNSGVTYDRQLPYRAELAVRGGAGLAHLLGHRIAIQAEGRGARPVTRQNTVWLDPYLRLDVTGRITLIPQRLHLGVAARNILDEHYVETRFYPDPGREFRVSLEAQW